MPDYQPVLGDTGSTQCMAQQPPAARASRRAFLRGAGAIAGFWGTVRAAQSARAALDPPDISADVDPGALIPKLVRRISMGVTPEELALANSLGYSAYLEYQLNHTAIDDSQMAPRLAALTTLNLQPYELYPLPSGQVINELTEATILRSIYSRRQLFERMVEFWTDHFNIEILKEDCMFLKTGDDRDVIRANALGTFPDLLRASAHSAAMMYYLDNYTSRVNNINENYSREIMELHTLGVDGGYTQADVVAVARCFTGWGRYPYRAPVPPDPPDQNSGLFRYRASDHDNTQKIVLGNIIPANGGQQDGETVLNILAGHPNTARHVAVKLCRWLLGPNVPQSVVTEVAAAYTSSAGDIKQMIRTALKPNVLHDAAPKYKRPYHLFVSILRATGANVGSTATLRGLLNSAGQRPFYWSPPDGYPDFTEHWIGLILPRWNFPASLMNNNVSGVTVDDAAFYTAAVTAEQMADRLNDRFAGGEMPDFERNRLRDYLLPNPPSTGRRREAMGLAASAPSFQWY